MVVGVVGGIGANERERRRDKLDKVIGSNERKQTANVFIQYHPIV